VFSTVQAAYDDSATLNNTIIKLLEGVLTGNFTSSRNIAVTLEGGYNAAYSGISSEITLSGTVVLKSGAVKIKGIRVR
jgi:hypothetical protein